MNLIQQVAYVNAQAVAARIELEAMLAENNWRTSNNMSPAYSEMDIKSLIDKYGLGHNQILNTFEG